ncbi:MAG: hypothetical protein MR868_13815 [Lachnospiraceae bacterium]|nr:hypothetical protein [Lachnospiraceae bacterium]
MLQTGNVMRMVMAFIAASFQWGTYSGAGGYNSASTFSTNNLKQCVWGWTEYAVTREEKAKEKAVSDVRPYIFSELSARSWECFHWQRHIW